MISGLEGLDGTEVLVKGFVVNTRVLRRVVFLIVQDRSGSVQVMVERGEPATGLERVAVDVTPGSAVEVRGTFRLNPHVKAGGMEIAAAGIDVVSRAEPGLPVEEASAPELQLDWRFLSLRRPRHHLLFEVQTTTEKAMRDFWIQRGFVEIHSPKLMHSASESGSETFSMEYFELGKAYLAQSPQFYKQMAMAAGLERVFEIGPVFRAEPSMTPRHATEFTSVDLEMSWIDSHEDVMSFEEEWLRSILQTVSAEHGEEIAKHFGVEVRVPPVPFPRITMEEAHAFLARAGHEIAPATKPGDLDTEGERIIARHMLEERGSEFFFITEYPVSLRPFYHMRDPERPHVTRSFDLLWKGVEITTGAQREHRYEQLARQAQEAGLRESVEYYLDFFRYGCPPHGGLGFGLARMLMLMLGLPSIREATFLHRSPNRLTP
ncbi:MAG TPA: aspartate--tRNA(Asn) ligase [Longimicrobium sp.]|jgi:aspartyl-tRNA synthetase